MPVEKWVEVAEVLGDASCLTGFTNFSLDTPGCHFQSVLEYFFWNLILRIISRICNSSQIRKHCYICRKKPQVLGEPGRTPVASSAERVIPPPTSRNEAVLLFNIQNLNVRRETSNAYRNAGALDRAFAVSLHVARHRSQKNVLAFTV